MYRRITGLTNGTQYRLRIRRRLLDGTLTTPGPESLGTPNASAIAFTDNYRRQTLSLPNIRGAWESSSGIPGGTEIDLTGLGNTAAYSSTGVNSSAIRNINTDFATAVDLTGAVGVGIKVGALIVGEDPLSAPRNFRAVGQTLRWDRVAEVSSYNFVAKTPTNPTGVFSTITVGATANMSYDAVSGEIVYTPPAQPGITVTYGVRTIVTGSVWASPEVSIAYAPVNPPPTLTGTFIGMSSQGGDAYLDTARKLRAKIKRKFDTNPSVTVASINTSMTNIVNNGMSPIILYNWGNGLTLSDAAIANIANHARTWGPGGTFWSGRTDSRLAMRWVEWGNEFSYSYRSTAGYAVPYATMAVKAMNALQSAGNGVQLLVEAEVNNFPDWVSRMRAAQPNLASHPNFGGWVAHPYGPKTRYDRIMTGSTNAIRAAGWPVDRTHAFHITEYGAACTNNGRVVFQGGSPNNYEWPNGMTPTTYAPLLEAAVKDMIARYVVEGFYIFQERDRAAPSATSNREDYFGICNLDGSDKAAVLTAACQRLADSSSVFT